MKIFRILGIALTAVLMCVNYLSCSNNSNKTICYETIDGIRVRLEHEDVFGGAKIISNTYSTTKGYGTIEFASEVTAIETEAFSYSTNLKSITIPHSVASLGNCAFAGCLYLTSVTIGNSVTRIGDRAFSGCSSLTYVNIPNSVTSIGDNAFEYCDNINRVHAQSLEALECNSNIFTWDVYNNATLFVPKESINLYRNTEPWCNFKRISWDGLQ